MLTLRLANFSSEKDLDLIYNFFNLPESAIFWSPEKFKVSDKTQLYDKLNQEWGSFYFFIEEKNDELICVFVAYGVSPVHQRANILCWLAPEYRNGVVLINFHTSFMLHLHNLNLHRVYGKILENNTVAIKAAERFGYTKCGILPEFINKDGKKYNAVIVTRSTELNPFERKYLIMHTKMHN